MFACNQDRRCLRAANCFVAAMTKDFRSFANSLNSWGVPAKSRACNTQYGKERFRVAEFCPDRMLVWPRKNRVKPEAHSE
jgi:hypothetical protein